VKDAEACEAPPSASAAGLLTLKLNDAHHLSGLPPPSLFSLPHGYINTLLIYVYIYIYINTTIII
jgi:hypothetical protein